MRKTGIITALLAISLLTLSSCAVPDVTARITPEPIPALTPTEAVTTPETACPVPETTPGQWNFVAGPVKYVFEVTPASGQSYLISQLQVYPVEAEVGDIVTFNAVVTNTGVHPDTYTVELKYDGTLIRTQAVTVNGGESQKLAFDITAAFGNFEVLAGQLTAGFRVFF